MEARSQLYPVGAAIGARIVGRFERSAGVEHHRAGVTHDVAVGLGQHLDLVASRNEALDQIAVEARLHAQIVVRRTPGAAEQPARRVDRAFERRSEESRGA